MKILPRLLLSALAWAAALRAEPLPGDVFREYTWSDKGKWQRITSPDAIMAGAKEFLPNAVNTIDLADLAGATRIEVQLELLQSHYGTTGQSIRLNGGEWLPIPRSPHIPGDAGSEKGASDVWLTMLYPIVDLPLTSVKAGRNTFEFTCRPGTGLGAKWPQSIVYGVIFRVYYGSEKPAPSGRVLLPADKLNRFAALELMAEANGAGNRSIRRVDFLGRYRGYDWRGEGVQERWHYHTAFGELRRHAGTAFAAPWKVTWDFRNVPMQDNLVQIVARIEDDTGLCRITEAVTLDKLRGMPGTRVFAAHAVPPHWQARAGKRYSCKFTLPDDLSRLAEAWLILATWNGDQADEIGINATALQRNIGFNHDLSYNEVAVPISALKAGENEFYTKSATEHHGIEVLWPGAVLVVRFAPEAPAH